MITDSGMGRGGVIFFVASLAILLTSAAPAQEAASRPSAVAEANRLMDEGQYAKASETLSGAGSAYMNDPAYFVALGRAYLGAVNYSMASTAFTTAIGKKTELPDAHLRLACAKALLKNFKGATESIDQAVKLDPADARIPYASCLIHMLSGEFDKAQPDIDSVGKLEGPFSKSVADQLKGLFVFAKEQADLAAKRQAEIVTLKDTADKATQAFQDLKKGWETANAEKAKMVADRDKEKDQAQKDYQTTMNDIVRNYNSKLPPASLQKSNPSQYNTQKSQADQYKSSAEKDAVQKRDQTLTGIENKYKPLLEAADKKIKDLSDQGAKKNTEMAACRQKLAAQEAQNKQYQPPWPFDVQAALRTLPPPGAPASQPAAGPVK